MDNLEQNKIISLLYELSMAIGTSLQLNEMMSFFSFSLLKKLNCDSCIFFEISRIDKRLFNIHASPKDTIFETFYDEILIKANIFQKEIQESFLYDKLSNNTYGYFYHLPDVGIFVFTRKKKLDDAIAIPMVQIAQKLSISIQSCINYNTLKTHKSNLSLDLEKEKKLQKAKDQFLANMSHEIRTPIHGIISFIGLLKETSLSKTQNEYLDIIENSSDILLKIINDILDFSKLQSGKMILENKPFNCQKEMQSVSKIFNAIAQEKNLQFTIDIDQNIPYCLLFDGVRIKQVITNLLGNAFKFTNDGEVYFGIKKINENNKTISLRFSIKDTGIGISKEKQKSIFDSFSQADNSITRRFGGTGLGLSIAKNILSTANSDLHLESKENFGSHFFFDITLPICNKTQKNNMEDQENCILEYIYTNTKILLVEDNPINQVFMRKLLNSKEIEVVICSNGQEAVERYTKDQSFDLIFMDINMPILSGIEATKQILDFEAQYNIIHTPIIALTANIFDKLKKECKSSGFDDLLSKPFKKIELDNILHSYLAKNNKKLKKYKGHYTYEENYNIQQIATSLDVEDTFVIKLLKIFFDFFEEKYDLLLQAQETNDFEQIANLIHTLKGSAGSIQLNTFYDLSLEMEQAAIHKETQYNFTKTTQELHKSIQIYKDIVENYVKNK